MAGKVNEVSWQDALKRLQEGNERFQNDNLEHQLQDGARREHLADHQIPYAIILSCADSRVAPELTFDTGLGEIFIIRVAGNVANVETIASIEYAVHAIKTNLIVVLGHESCGAVGAAVGGGDYGTNLNILLSQIQPAIANSPQPDVNSVVKTNAEIVAQNLRDRSQIIRDAIVKEGRVKIIPAYYHLASGKVEFMQNLAV